MRAYNWVYFLFTGRWAYSWGVAGGGGISKESYIRGGLLLGAHNNEPKGGLHPGGL